MDYGPQGKGEEPQSLHQDIVSGYLAVHHPSRKHCSSHPKSPGCCLLFVKVTVFLPRQKTCSWRRSFVLTQVHEVQGFFPFPASCVKKDPERFTTKSREKDDGARSKTCRSKCCCFHFVGVQQLWGLVPLGWDLENTRKAAAVVLWI